MLRWMSIFLAKNVVDSFWSTQFKLNQSDIQLHFRKYIFRSETWKWIQSVKMSPGSGLDPDPNTIVFVDPNTDSD